jgi:hypothetical protein
MLPVYHFNDADAIQRDISVRLSKTEQKYEKTGEIPSWYNNKKRYRPASREMHFPGCPAGAHSA